jgi:hypothetical protein
MVAAREAGTAWIRWAGSMLGQPPGTGSLPAMRRGQENTPGRAELQYPICAGSVTREGFPGRAEAPRERSAIWRLSSGIVGVRSTNGAPFRLDWGAAAPGIQTKCSSKGVLPLGASAVAGAVLGVRMQLSEVVRVRAFMLQILPSNWAPGAIGARLD